MSLLDPLSHALAAVVAAAHAGLTSLGLDPSAGPVWVLSVAAVVVTVRLALLPLAVHAARQARAAAAARPHLRALAERYRDRTRPRLAPAVRRGAPPDRRRAPALAARLPPAARPAAGVVRALPPARRRRRGLARGRAGRRAGRLVRRGDPARRTPGGARLPRRRLGRRRARRHGRAADLRHPAVRRGAGRARRRAGGVARVQQLLPALSAAGLLVAAGFVPVALLVYWVVNSAWTLGQTAALRRILPTG